MYCLKCREHREGVFCPECGSKLVEDPAGAQGGLHLGDANAISGGIHYSETNNVTNNITNNNHIVYEAQKTDSQIAMENIAAFTEAVFIRISDGIMDPLAESDLERQRIIMNIPVEKAEQIIQSVKKSQSVSNNNANEFISSQFVQDIREAISFNNTDYLKTQIVSLKKLVETSSSQDIRFYYYLLLASFSPESVVVELIGSRVDDYWQLLWAYISYLKLGNERDSTSLLPRISAFDKRRGDISILLAIKCLRDSIMTGQVLNKRQADKYLEQAATEGISEILFPIWRTLNEIAANETGQTEEALQFYINVTFKELTVARDLSHSSSVGLRQSPQPNFDAQRITLPQMQGFNPIEAVRQMGMGGISSMQASKIEEKDIN